MRISTSAPPKTPHILIVDDNSQGLIARRAVLEEQGYRVWSATGGDEALELLAKQEFDVVVTDYKMPHINGGELIRRIRAQNPDARIILLSGFVDLLGLSAESTGANVVIHKSASEVGNLTRSVKRLLGQAPVRKPPARAVALKAKKAGE
jgi:CheY-like chemotaxis protein